jgi:hypothetical protein
VAGFNSVSLSNSGEIKTPKIPSLKRKQWLDETLFPGWHVQLALSQVLRHHQRLWPFTKFASRVRLTKVKLPAAKISKCNESSREISHFQAPWRICRWIVHLASYSYAAPSKTEKLTPLRKPLLESDSNWRNSTHCQGEFCRPNSPSLLQGHLALGQVHPYKHPSQNRTPTALTSAAGELVSRKNIRSMSCWASSKRRGGPSYRPNFNSMRARKQKRL